MYIKYFGQLTLNSSKFNANIVSNIFVYKEIYVLLNLVGVTFPVLLNTSLKILYIIVCTKLFKFCVIFLKFEINYSKTRV